MLFYLVGIKGSAMSALAKILNEEGHLVMGVDVLEDFYTSKDLNGIHLEDFDHMNLKDSYFYIIGNAFMNHDVTKYIMSKGWKYLSYPKFLVYHFKNKKWLTIAGTHGKTTSTKMLSTILKDTTSLIGDGDYSFGLSDYFILEACEYRDTFLNYHSDIALVLNVDYDHVDYFKTKEDYDASFIKFINQSRLAVVNGDEFNYRSKNMITFGLDPDNDVKFSYEDGKVSILNKSFYLPIKGLKYAYDFVGVYLVSKLLNLNDSMIQFRLNKFKMPRRRFERYKLPNQIVVLDYAHHPNEINTIYETIKEEYPLEQKICIFEPHTITRLLAFKDDFKKVLSLFDKCYLYELFSSVREHHDIGLEERLYDELGFELYEENKISNLNGVVCFLGAGIIDKGCIQYLKQRGLGFCKKIV